MDSLGNVPQQPRLQKGAELPLLKCEELKVSWLILPLASTDTGLNWLK